MMNATITRTFDRDSSPENFAAEVTEAVFPVALRYGVGNRWLDLELDLWRALSETVENCARDLRGVGLPALTGPGSPEECMGCRQGLVVGLADTAYRTTLRHGARESNRGAREGLYQAFRGAIWEKVSGLRRAQA
jgi:hypothetical protein